MSEKVEYQTPEIAAVFSVPPPGQPMPPIPLKLALKLAECLGEIPPVPKLGHHEQQGYAYPRAADISAATRVVLSKHKIFLLWRPVPGFEWREFQSSRQNSLMREVTIWFDLTLVDAESGEMATVRWPGTAADMITSDKVLAKAQTAALKTFLVMQFQIPDDGADSDRSAETEEGGRSRTPRQQQPNWPKQVRGVATEVESKEGWMFTVKGIRYFTRVKAFAEQMRNARGREVEFSAEIGKGPEGERCPVITKILNVAPPPSPAPSANSSTPAPPTQGPGSKSATAPMKDTTSVIPPKEELF